MGKSGSDMMLQFYVSWWEAPLGGDQGPSGDVNFWLRVHPAASDLQAIVLTDDNGGDYTYYQLRDLGRKLGFNVGWSAEKGVYIESDKSYQG